MKADISVEIAAPPHRVWEIITDVENWPSWTPSVTSVKRLDTGPLRVGSEVKIKQPRLPVAKWTVTELSPGNSFTWVAVAPGVRTTATHRVQPTEVGSGIILELDQSGPVGSVFGRLTVGMTNRYLAMEANGLRDRAEGLSRGSA